MTGTGSLTVSGFNSNSLTVGVSLTNTSTSGGQGGERLTGFGFGIDPNATSVGFSDLSDGGMIGATLGSLPSLSTIEICAYSNNNCQGGGNGGIFGAGGTDSFSIILGGTWGSSVNIDPIGFKYQTGYGSFEFTSSTSTTSTTSTTGTSSGTSTTSTTSTGGSSGAAPEPLSTTMVGLGLALLGLTAHRRRRRLAAAAA